MASLNQLNLGPRVIRSEPTTPIYATNSVPEEAPNSWFGLITSKEKIAVLTMESIPLILSDMSKDHSATDLDQLVSPRLLPLLERMKFHFSRTMALARYEAENGRFELRPSTDTNAEADGIKQKPAHHSDLSPDEVMGALEVEAFFARVEEIRLGGKDHPVVYRRYWRILARPLGLELQLGGVNSAGNRTMQHSKKKNVKECMKEHWNQTPKLLIAEFKIQHDGCAYAGKILERHSL